MREKFTRRDVLKTMGIGLGGHMLFFGTGTLYKKRNSILEALAAPEPKLPVFEEARAFLSDNYGIEVTTGETWDPTVFGEKIPQELAADMLEVIIEEVGKYPPDFFKRNKLHRIHLLANAEEGLFLHTKPIRGIFQRLQKDSIILSYGNGDMKLLREVFHHELFHLLDYADGGFDQDDQRWRDMQKDCRCLPYGFDPLHLPSDVEAEVPFSTQYGSTSPSEDRAEFGSIMMTPEKHLQLLRRISGTSSAKVETVLLKKYSEIKAMYLRWSGGAMDDSYWQRLITQGVSYHNASEVGDATRAK